MRGHPIVSIYCQRRRRSRREAEKGGKVKPEPKLNNCGSATHLNIEIGVLDHSPQECGMGVMLIVKASFVLYDLLDQLDVVAMSVVKDSFYLTCLTSWAQKLPPLSDLLMVEMSSLKG